MPVKKNNKKSIPHWSNDDKPRERLISSGVHELSNSELLAIVLRSGSADKSAVELARDLLISVDNNLSEVEEMDVAVLTSFHGIGEVKAVTILAAFELGRRAQLGHSEESRKITSSELAYQAASRFLSKQKHEECWVLYLNQSNRLMHAMRASAGGVSATIVDVRLILKKGIELLASGLILCHNHPSGNLMPSKPDREITKKLEKAAALVDIKLIDHLIVAKAGYYSFADKGEIN